MNDSISSGISLPPDGSTPLTEDELDGLLPSGVTTKAELNQWEAANIADAYVWMSQQSSLRVLSMEWLRALHRHMFDRTWKWAGQFRQSDNNISPYPWHSVPTLVRSLVDDTAHLRTAYDSASEALDDVAMRFHHRLVRIHPWPNGNGRHARLATDALLEVWERPIFTWGNGTQERPEESARDTYIRALRAADAGEFSLLRHFVHS